MNHTHRLCVRILRAVILATTTCGVVNGACAGDWLWPTNVAALVRRTSCLQGYIEGSLQQINCENITLNGNAKILGDLLVPGTPSVRLNGHPVFQGICDASGQPQPSNHWITLNGNAELGHIVRRIDPISLPNPVLLQTPTGNRSVVLNRPGDSPGDFGTIRDLTVNGNAGVIPIPPGCYGVFRANGSSGFSLGTTGATQTSSYQFNQLLLNGQSELRILSPVEIWLGGDWTLNGCVGSTNHPSWLTAKLSQGSVTLNGNSYLCGLIETSQGSVIINGNSQLWGTVKCDHLTINGRGCLKWGGIPDVPNHPPIAQSQTPSLFEDTPLPITLTGLDIDGDPLQYQITAPPTNGVLTGTAPDLIYTPNPNLNGTDAFTFTVFDGSLSSAPAAINLTILAVNDPPALSVPGSLSVVSGQTIEFGTTNLISVTDVDAGTGPIKLALAVSHGRLAFGDTNGLAFVAGENGSNTMTVSGVVSDLNQALSHLSYTSEAGFSGNDSLDLTVDDQGHTGGETGLTDIKQAGINVVAVPVGLTVDAGPDRTVVWTNRTVSFEVLVQDNLPAGSPIALVWSVVSGAASASFSPEMTTLIQPANNQSIALATQVTFDGPGIYVLRVSCDDTLVSTNDEIAITVVPPSEPLLALDQSLIVNEDSWITFNLMGYEPTGNAITEFALVRAPEHGSVTLYRPWNGIQNNTLGAEYTPNPNYHGPDSFAFIVSDGITTSAEGTVTITVLSANDVPVTESFSLLTEVDRSIAFLLQGTDADKDSLGFIVVAPPEHGSLSLDTSASTATTIRAQYVPEAGYSGPDQFVYRAYDGQDYSADTPVAISVTPVAAQDLMQVEAGPNQHLDGAGSIALAGSVWIPNPVSGAQTNVNWSMATGPGSIVFTAANALETQAAFTEPGTYVLLLTVEYAGCRKRDTLTVNVLAGTASPKPQVRSNRGTDFWFAMLQNSQSWGEPSKAGVSVMIAADVDTTGAISWKDGNFNPMEQSFQVQAGVPTLVNLIDYWGAPRYPPNSITSDAIHVTSANPVTVFELNYMEASTDGYTALPTPLLGREYWILCYGNDWMPWFQDDDGNPSLAEGTQYAVVGVQDDTTVTITPSFSSSGRSAGVSYSIVLQTGETYRMIDSTTPNGDFSGTRIVSDKPVAVFGGHQSTSLPRGLFGYCDHLEEQLPPVELWGRRFFTMPLATRQNGDTFRILAARDGTEVRVNGELLIQLGPGQWHEFTLTNSAEIVANQPILLAQYANSIDYDGVTGDPFMMVIPAVEQYGCSYLLSTTSEYDYYSGVDRDFFDNYLTLIVPAASVDSITIDGQLLDASQFSEINASGYSGARVHVGSGSHLIEGPVGFGASLYGWVEYESYAFMGGLHTDFLEPECQLELTQVTGFAAVGTEKTVTAKVRNPLGQPMPNIQVQFTVNGANPASGWVKTSHSGEAVFAYIGTNMGSDVIQAKAASLVQTITNTWIEATANQPPSILVTTMHAIRARTWYEIPATVSDDGLPAGDGLTVQWRFVSGPAIPTILTNAPASLSALFDISGFYVFELAANDTQFNVRSLITVGVNSSPQISLEFQPDQNWHAVGEPIQFLVWASDPSGRIQSVELFEGDQRVGLLTAPNGEYQAYCFYWTPITNGLFNLTAIATDNWGDTAQSTVSLSAGYAPTVTLLSPTNGQIFAVGEPLMFGATAGDIDGTVQYVNYYYYSEALWSDWIVWWNLASVAGEDYEYSWRPASHDGNILLLSASALDNHNLRSPNSEPIVVFISNSGASGNIAPAISLSFPTNTLLLSEPTNLLLQASASDSDGTISQVEFYDRGVRLGRLGPSANGIYQMEWAVTNNDAHSIFAVAFDNQGGISRSDMVTVMVATPQRLTWICPTNAQDLVLGKPALLHVQLEEAAGSVTNVEYYIDNTFLGQGSGTSLSVRWFPTTPGEFNLRAFATGNQSLVARSDPLAVRVQIPLPQIEVVHPANNQRLQLAQPSYIQVVLDDPAGAITNFDVHIDGLLYTNTSQRLVEWTPLITGEHLLEVLAVDRFGQSIASSPVCVMVTNLQPPTVSILAPSDGAQMSAGSILAVHIEASDPDGQIAWLALDTDGSALEQASATTLDITLTNLMPGWHWLVARAADSTSLTTASEPVRFFVQRTVDNALPQPSGLQATAPFPDQIQLEWTPAPADALLSSLIIERFAPEENQWIELDQSHITNTIYTDHTVKPGQEFRYRLAFSTWDGRQSAYSSEASGSTPLPSPLFAWIDLSTAMESSLHEQQNGSSLATNTALPYYDGRRAQASAAHGFDQLFGAQGTGLKMAAARFQQRWPSIQLDFDPILFTPQSILPRSGFLTGPGGSGITVSPSTAQLIDPSDPLRPLKAFLIEHSALFGFGPEILTTATVQRDYVTSHNQARTLVWQQHLEQVPLFDTLLIAHMTSSNELASVSSTLIPNPEAAADTNLLNRVSSGLDLPVTAAMALTGAVTNVGDVIRLGQIEPTSPADGVARRQAWRSSSGIQGTAYSQLAWFPASRIQLRLCWQILFTSHWRHQMYLTLVAADTGEVLLRRCLTSTLSDITFHVYTNASPSPLLPSWPSPSSAQPPILDRAWITMSALHTNASPLGWICDGVNETMGNNVNAYLDRNDNDEPDLPRPAGNPFRCFDGPLDLSAPPESYGQASVVQLFYWANWMHDVLYTFGFTEAAGNFQNDNLGLGGIEADAVQAEAQDGLGLDDFHHRNNASMSTPPDGFAPRLQVYTFTGPDPDRDSALDAEIILHEYTHGLSTRLVGGGGGGLATLASSGLGEGWSDFYPLALLSNPESDAQAPYAFGGYSTYLGFGTGFDQNYYFGIRRYPYSTDTNINPLTFKDIDPLQAVAHDEIPRNPLFGSFNPALASEVHHQGEVWGVMLWEVRARLIAKHGGASGSWLAVQLITDGLRLAPPHPNWIQARDAILLADRLSSGGANESDLWAAFAKRGLGCLAQAPESGTTIGLIESFVPQPSLIIDRVEIEDGNQDNIIDANEDCWVRIQVKNCGNAQALEVIGTLTSLATGVTVPAANIIFGDLPPGASSAPSSAQALQISPTFSFGTPIGLQFVAQSGSIVATNYLCIFTGIPAGSNVFFGASALASSPPDTNESPSLSVLDLAKLEPLWMADAHDCLLKAKLGRYLYWSPQQHLQELSNPKFLAHRLTRYGQVVGRLVKDPIMDEYGNTLPRTVGAKWTPGESEPVEITGGTHAFPDGSVPMPYVGTVLEQHQNPATGELETVFLGCTGVYPHIEDVWDMTALGQAVGAASVYVTPTDFNQDGAIDPNEIERSVCEHHQIANQTLSWWNISEWGLSAGYEPGAQQFINYNVLVSSAALFESQQWKWIGPESFAPGCSTLSIALLINDVGMVAGYGAYFTGNPVLDALPATRAFRWFTDSTAFTPATGPVVVNLGVLPGHIHSFPRAINSSSEIVGYSDDGGSVRRAVYWAPDQNAPADLGALGNAPGSPGGYSDAFAINTKGRIVGTSLQSDLSGNGQQVASAVLWQRGASGSAAQWQITDLNRQLPHDPSMSWHVLRALGIHDDGVILASADRGIFGAHGQFLSWEPRAVLLVPTEIAVDKNRDGKIQFIGDGFYSDMTTQDKPYRFWLNNDQDEQHYSIGYSDPDPEFFPPQVADNLNIIIEHKRDLEDFARLHLRVGGFYQELIGGTLRLGLKWKHIESADGSGPALRLYYACETNGGWEYIRNPRVAQQQVKGLFALAIQGANNQLAVEPGSAFQFQPDFWKDLSEHNTNKFLLFEGLSEGKGYLVTTFHKANGVEIGEGPGIWLDLKNIRRFYLRAHTTPMHDHFPDPYDQIDPPSQPYLWSDGGLTVPEQNLDFAPGDGEETLDELPFEKDPEEEKKCLVFVHGIALTKAEFLGYSDTFYKRLWWAGYRGRFAAFRWGTPDSEWADGYSLFNDGEFRAWTYGPALTRYVSHLRQRMGSGAIMSLAAHSLGNAVAGSALRSGMKVDNYAALQAAVSLSCYFDAPADPQNDPLEKSFVNRLTDCELTNPTPDHYTEMGYRGFLKGITTNIVNRFYSYLNKDDFWLATGERFGIETTWIANQAKCKPYNPWDSTKYLNPFYTSLVLQGYLDPKLACAYVYRPDQPVESRAVLDIFGDMDDRVLVNPHESLAYVARSRTRALGAEPIGLALPQKMTEVDLQLTYEFGTPRYDHSGQFLKDIQNLYTSTNEVSFDSSFYSQLMNNLKIAPSIPPL